MDSIYLIHIVKASNEAIYSGGYRPNVREEAVKYQSRSDHWNEREKFPSKVDDRRDGSRMQKFDIPRASEQQRPSEQESNRSRSPKRDRSPVRDRYKRHSPSPRSPRRSWALEKRRSPEIREPPPPPVWPQEREEYTQQVRPKFPERGFEKNSPVWETRETKRDDFQSSNDRPNFPERPKEIGKWKPIPESSSPPNTSSSRFEEPTITRKEFETRRDFTHDDDNRKGHRDRHEKDYRRERSDTRFKPELDAKEEVPRKRDEYSGRIEEKKKEILLKQEQLQKEIDEVYKRAVDFSKKAEIYRMGEKNVESNFDDGRHRNDRQNPKEMQRYKREPYEDDRDRGDYRRDNKGQFIRGEDAKKLDSEDFKKSRASAEIPKAYTINLIRSKRNKAVDEISEKIMNKHGDFLSGEIKKRVMDELKWTLGRKMYDMFEDNDVSFIEMVVKFNAKHSPKDEENIFNEVMSSLPNHFRNLKRSTQDDSDIPAKSSRRSLEPSSNKDLQSGATEQNIPDWNIGMIPQTIPDINPMSMINPPMLVHPMPPYQQYVPVYQEIPQPEEEKKKDGFVLYLCKDDFQPILEFETDLLKNFLIQQLIKITETTQGWAPDFTLNNKINSYRHEVVTRDKLSQDWLLGLDFSEFKEFNVLVYTTEELWYERAAIWLPGHSRSKNIEPLVKLKLQNKKLEGVNIGKWKTVKKIVTAKGTRLYVDMPPSSARALEKCKMLLSYELQKVNVFLKAVAIDKDAFDAGLNEASLPFIPAAASTSMPSVGEHPDLVKMALKGNKPLSLSLARKLKDIILYKLFKYHELNGKSRTDFVNYGCCQGGFFGVVPENEESKRWLCGLDMGNIQRQPVIIIGADGNKTKYFKMVMSIPKDLNLNAATACERIRNSNQGIKGLNFRLWKNPNIIIHTRRGRYFTEFEVDMDLESVETLSRINFQLDYIAKGTHCGNLIVKSEYSKEKLKEMIAKYKAEMKDTYDVANMDISTDSENDDDVICLE